MVGIISPQELHNSTDEDEEEDTNADKSGQDADRDNSYQKALNSGAELCDRGLDFAASAKIRVHSAIG
jgi:hypothetical protein